VQRELPMVRLELDAQGDFVLLLLWLVKFNQEDLKDTVKPSTQQQHPANWKVVSAAFVTSVSHKVGITESRKFRMNFSRTFASATTPGPRSGRISPFTREPNLTSSSRLVAASSPESSTQSGSGLK
jgi:hypothetical protein